MLHLQDEEEINNETIKYTPLYHKYRSVEQCGITTMLSCGYFSKAGSMQQTLIKEPFPVSETKRKTRCGKITVICTEAIKVNIEAEKRSQRVDRGRLKKKSKNETWKDGSYRPRKM